MVAEVDVTARPWSGVRILDLSWWLGPYAGRLFADLGADVTRVEPPGGLPDRPAPGTWDPRFAFLNAGKQSMTLDIGTPEGRTTFVRLAGVADAVILERGGPLWDMAEALRAAHPLLVVLCVSPFGRTGPMAQEPASDLTLQAAGGIAWMSGRPGAPPLRLPFGQAAMMTSVYAATALSLALTDAEVAGRGHLIDVSAQECIAHSLQNAVQVWDLEHRVSMRGGEGTRDATEDVFPCADGFVFLAAPLALGQSWQALVGWIAESHHPAATEFLQPRWSDRAWRLTSEARAAFRAALVPFLADKTQAEITAAAMARRIVMSPVARVADTFADPQLASRGYFRTLPAGPDGAAIAFPGPPFRLTPDLWQTAPAMVPA